MMRSAIALVVLCLAGAALSQSTPPTFPNNFSDIESDELVQNQGGSPSADGQSICCPLGSPNCQVQVQFSSGHNYFALDYNATRFDQAGADSVIVNDFTLNLEMEVDPATMACQAACPLDEGTLTPYAIDANATNIGTKVINGKNTTGWQWKTVILGVIVMETETIYVAQDSTGAYYPVLDYTDLTPFGEDIGYESTTYLSFTAGLPDKSLFAVTGAASCPPPSNGCGNDNALRKMNRIRNRLYKTYLRAELEGKMELSPVELEALQLLNEERDALMLAGLDM